MDAAEMAICVSSRLVTAVRKQQLFSCVRRV